MSLVLVVVSLGAIFVIAAIVVGREARRLGTTPARQVFDFDDAVTYICDNVGDEVSAVLSVDDVRRILRWHLEYFRLKGVSGNGSAVDHEGPVFVTGAETVSFVLSRSEQAGADYTSEQVHAVLEAQIGYLGQIGAMGPAGEDEIPPSVSGG